MKTTQPASGLAAAALACALLLSGCSGGRMNGLRTSAAPIAAPVTSPLATRTTAPAVSACPFSITSIDDQRGEKSLGLMIRTLVDGESFSTWFADGLRAIPGHAPQGAPATIRVEVLRAYIQSLSTMKSANLVVRVHTTNTGAASPRVKLYRGVDRSVNWWNSESEVQLAFDNAMNDLRQQLASDLALNCPR